MNPFGILYDVAIMRQEPKAMIINVSWNQVFHVNKSTSGVDMRFSDVTVTVRSGETVVVQNEKSMFSGMVHGDHRDDDLVENLRFFIERNTRK